MNGECYAWRKMKDKDIPACETLLRAIERKYVSACGKFLARKDSGGYVWTLQGKKRIKNACVSGLLVYSRTTVMPVLNGIKEVPKLNFLNSFIRKGKIHSAQGPRDEVAVLEKEMEKTGMEISEIYDYDLMSLDSLPKKEGFLSGPSNLVLRAPGLTDLDALAPLQAAYEHEEVFHKGSVFSPAASRVNLANIISRGQMLAAEISGRIVGKININAVSFTRCQVGGVYVHPDFRSLGIARRMAAEFISSLVNEGRGVTLFVKKSNVPARRLYLGLGFTVTGDYRITYY
jgi:ribosomal protein S18 acetylase RimI-like enzyme